MAAQLTSITGTQTISWWHVSHLYPNITAPLAQSPISIYRLSTKHMGSPALNPVTVLPNHNALLRLYAFYYYTLVYNYIGMYRRVIGAIIECFCCPGCLRKINMCIYLIHCSLATVISGHGNSFLFINSCILFCSTLQLTRGQCWQLPLWEHHTSLSLAMQTYCVVVYFQGQNVQKL